MSGRKVISLLVLSAPLLSFSAQADQPPLVVHTSQLTLETARKMADAAIAACEKAGYQVAATVVDRDGVPQISERSTLAPPLALKISFDKAYTSAMFEAKGSKLAQQFTARRSLAEAGEHLAFSGGSVPIEAGGKFYGAIGVSGTPSSSQDEVCAQAGFDAVREDLEMQP